MNEFQRDASLTNAENLIDEYTHEFKKRLTQKSLILARRKRREIISLEDVNRAAVAVLLDRDFGHDLRDMVVG